MFYLSRSPISQYLYLAAVDDCSLPPWIHACPGLWGARQLVQLLGSTSGHCCPSTPCCGGAWIDPSARLSGPFSELKSPITRLLLLHLGPISHPPTPQPGFTTDSALAAFILASQCTPPGGLPYRPSGGEKGVRKRNPPPGSLVSSKQFKSSGSPRRTANKLKRQDPELTSRCRVKHSALNAPKLLPHPPSLSLPLSLRDPHVTNLRDPRIPNDGRSVGIGKIFLPLMGRVSSLYDRKGAKSGWRPSKLAICSYHRTWVRNSVATRPDYTSAYLATLIPQDWDIDA